MSRSRFLLAAAFCAVVLLAPLAWAQENATITGSVLDPTGAVIPNVAITLTNVATGQVRETTSNSSGIYTFANVGVGHFNLDATAPGFQKFTQNGHRCEHRSDPEGGRHPHGRQRSTDGHRAGERPAGAIGNQRAQHPDHRPAGHPVGDQRPQCDRACGPGLGRVQQLAGL